MAAEYGEQVTQIWRIPNPFNQQEEAMQYVEAPTDLSNMEYRWPHPWVFVAGGITGCPPWQWELCEMLEDYECGTLFQPRREDFPIDDPSAAEKQIQWEKKALWACDVFSIWFCGSESVQPICMFELGAHSSRACYDEVLLAVGVDPEYQRAQDVEIQMSLIRPVSISDSLEEHADLIRRKCKRWVPGESHEHERMWREAAQ